jgi:hypothetical protein
MVGIHSRELLAVAIEYRHLPVTMLAPFIFSERGTLFLCLQSIFLVEGALAISQFPRAIASPFQKRILEECHGYSTNPSLPATAIIKPDTPFCSSDRANGQHQRPIAWTPLSPHCVLRSRSPRSLRRTDAASETVSGAAANFDCRVDSMAAALPLARGPRAKARTRGSTG